MLYRECSVRVAGAVAVMVVVAACGEPKSQSDAGADAHLQSDGGDVVDEVDAGPIGGSEPDYTEKRKPCDDRNPVRNVYFGDLHVHTSLSFDAYGFQVRNGPAEAYAFAKGNSTDIPGARDTMNGSRTVELDRPLDFAAVTDHSEYFGEIQLCDDSNSDVYDTQRCKDLRDGGNSVVVSFGSKLANDPPRRFQELCGKDGSRCVNRAGTTWERVQKAADDAYDRSSACEFTSFVGYEYTNAAKANSLHRNVIFRNGEVPNEPISTYEEPRPRGLWRRLKKECLEADTDCDVLAIPHNSNQSAGTMFGPTYPGASSKDEEREMAALRREVEPLFEIYQHKGAMECMMGLSGVLGQPDELCRFEKIHRKDVQDCGDETGFGGLGGVGCVSRWDFWRNVLVLGFREKDRLGVNPYRLGLVGGTDTHNATPGLVSESDWPGHIGDTDASPKTRLTGAAGGSFTTDGIVTSPGGLTGVWAVENSRDAIFEAMKRRETFATTGPRIGVRFFGGWELPEDMCSRSNFAEIGYRNGVAMGGDLPEPPSGDAKPKFAVMAFKDPGTDRESGTPLQRVQIVKGVVDADGKDELKVIDVAGNADSGSLETSTCEASGEGDDSLCTVWTDDDYRRGARTFYYVRVLENPTCRWSTRVCNELSKAERPEECDDSDHPKTIQERAWTSPIWHGG